MSQASLARHLLSPPSPGGQQQAQRDSYSDIRPDILEMIKVMLMLIMIDDKKHHHDDNQEEQKAKLMEPNKHWGQPPVPAVQGEGYPYQVHPGTRYLVPGTRYIVTINL